MIDRQGAKILFECNACDNVFVFEDHQEFTEAWTRRQTRWMARQEDRIGMGT